MLRGWTLLAAMTGIPVIGIMAALPQSFLSSTFASIPTLGSMFNYGDEAAQMDGRIQARDLLSSHFGAYGWPGQSFDYVIVGGGTAGLVMAKRLSQDNAASVAVIEAGGFYEIDSGNATEVPMYLFNYFFDNGHMKNPLFDWYQYTTPQPVRVSWRMPPSLALTVNRAWLREPCSTCKARLSAAAPLEVPCCTIGEGAISARLAETTTANRTSQRIQGSL